MARNTSRKAIDKTGEQETEDEIDRVVSNRNDVAVVAVAVAEVRICGDASGPRFRFGDTGPRPDDNFGQ